MRILKIALIGLIGLFMGCGDDDFPVPPASTVPRFSFTIDNDEFAPAEVTFTNESVVPERAGEVTYLWNFGDGTSSTEANPKHYYTTPGQYVVNLVVVTNESFEINEYSRNVILKDPNATGIPIFYSDGSTVFNGLINTQPPIFAEQGITAQDVYGLAVDTVNGKLYVSDYGAEKIFRSDLDGGNIEEFRTGVGGIGSLEIDLVNNMLYWDTGDGIRRADLDDPSTNQWEEFVTGQTNDPEGIGLDLVNNTVYWNNYDGGIWKKNMDGSGEMQIVPNTLGGGSIVVVGDKIIFDDFIASGDIAIRTADLNGGNVAPLISGVERLIFDGIVYEPTEEKLYWIDRGQGIIKRSNLDGSDVEDWYDAGTSLYGLAIGKQN